MEDLYYYLKDTPTSNPNVAVSLAIADASDDTEDATAVAADIREGKTAYIFNRMLMCHKETRKNLIDSIHYSIATASCLLK